MMHSCRRRAVVFAAAAITAASAGVAVPAAVAQLRDATPVSRHGGVIAWSERVGPEASAPFALMLSRGGVSMRAPIPTRAVPFDADLGPGSAGGVVAVYSRCRKEPALGFAPFIPSYTDGRGCALFRFDIGSLRERKLPGSDSAASDVLPTIWGEELAFARGAGGPEGVSALFVRRLDGRGRARSQPRPAGKVPVDSTPRSVDLHGTRVGAVWERADAAGEGRVYDARLGRVDAPPVIVARTGGGGLSQAYLAGAGFLRGRFVFALDCFGDPGGCGDRGLRRKLVRVDPAANALQATLLPSGGVSSLTADEAGTTYVVAGSADTPLNGNIVASPTAQLISVPGPRLVFTSAPRPIVPRPR